MLCIRVFIIGLYIALSFSASDAWADDLSSRTVIINGKILSQEELQHFDKLYCGVMPDGRYWFKEETLEWGEEGHASKGFLDSPCAASGEKPVWQIMYLRIIGRQLMVNGQAMQDQTALYRLEQLHCGPIASGDYWLDTKTLAWGYWGNQKVQGRIGDNCGSNQGRDSQRRKSLSERGMLFGCNNPPCHDFLY